MCSIRIEGLDLGRQEIGLFIGNPSCMKRETHMASIDSRDDYHRRMELDLSFLRTRPWLR